MKGSPGFLYTSELVYLLLGALTSFYKGYAVCNFHSFGRTVHWRQDRDQATGDVGEGPCLDHIGWKVNFWA